MSSLLKFFSLTYAVTWACFFGAAAVSGVAGPSGLRQPLLLLGTFAPALVALWLTARAGGSAGALALLRRLFAWRVGARWYVFAAGYMAAVKLAVAFVHRATTGAWPRFGQEAWIVILVAMAISTPVQAGEEIGWRGYALPGLAARFGFARASILLGLIWACWHLPLFFIPGVDNYGQSFLVFMLGVTPLSVAMAWLYGHAHGSLLLVMLMHSAVNQTSGIVPSAVAGATNPLALSASLVAWLTVAVLWVCAACFLVWMPKTELPA